MEKNRNGVGTTNHNKTGPGRLKRRHYPDKRPLSHPELDAITEARRGMPASQVREFDRLNAPAKRKAKAKQRNAAKRARRAA